MNTQDFSALHNRPTVFGVRPRTAAENAALHRWRTANPTLEREYQAIAERESEQFNAERDRWTVEASEAERKRSLVSRGIEASLQAECAASKETPATKAAEAWRASGKRWLVLSGSVGTGKTVAAARLVVGSGGLKVNATQMLKPHFDEMERERRAHMHTRLLVIDDLGIGALTEFSRAELGLICDHRHEAGRKTVITTNLGRDEFASYVGGRLADRIAQDGSFITLSGLSMRKNAQKRAETGQGSTKEG